MTKKILIPLLLAALVIALFFVKVQQQQVTSIKSSFLNVYATLSNPEKWALWQSSLRKAMANDSAKISFQNQPEHFSIRYDSLSFNIKRAETAFDIKEIAGGKQSEYTYTVVPGEFDKQQGNTSVITAHDATLGQYLLGLVSGHDFAETHVNDLKRYFETDSLYYGYTIFKTHVPQANLVQVSKSVLKKDQFTTAADLLTVLRAYMKKNNVKQMQPLLAQFLRKGADSINVNVGFFIDREIKPDGLVRSVRMPIGGPLYCDIYKGRFDKRQLAYNALDQYFTDHLYRQAIVPFEMYLDNKLPESYSDPVNIRINYTAYY